MARSLYVRRWTVIHPGIVRCCGESGSSAIGAISSTARAQSPPRRAINSAAVLNYGASRLLIVNRTFENAVTLASEVSGEPLPFEEFEKSLPEAEILICSRYGNDPYRNGPFQFITSGRLPERTRGFPQRRFLERLEWRHRFADPGFDDRLYPLVSGRDAGRDSQEARGSSQDSLQKGHG
jgi:Shikimate / quinate 5-dehydrogenase